MGGQLNLTQPACPPDHLAKRASGTVAEEFDAQGREIRDCIVRSLPADFNFGGKRVLDFGCGTGRVLRHFQTEAQKGEFWGCDIHAPSISWLAKNLPSCHVFQNRETAELPIEPDYFDLIYVVSVFTHLTTNWKAWLAELCRALKPGGILLITFHNRVAYEYATGQRFDEKSAGMLVCHPYRNWNEGGPMVYHSNWWVQEHWGEFLKVEYISREALFGWQSLAVLSKPETGVKKLQNSLCPILQPYPYQFCDFTFQGYLEIPNRNSTSLKTWHGIEIKKNKSERSPLSGWFVSEKGKITEISVILDGCEIATLPGTNSQRADVKAAFPTWDHSLNSGFQAALDLRPYGPGEHDLRIIATDTAGRQHELQSPLVLCTDKQSDFERVPLPSTRSAASEFSEIMSCKSLRETNGVLTVAVSLFNYRDYIIPCLESVKSQTLKDLDLIVVDDCSTDGSLTVVTDWLEKNETAFRDVLVIRHKSNRGLPHARNTAFAYAGTDFVFVLDADNLLYPRCLERLLGALKHCDASFAYCLLEKFGEETGIGNTKPWNPIALQHGNFIDAMVLHRKGAWEEAGGYATDMPAMGWEDFDLWFRIARAGGWGVQIPEILARYRVRRSSMLHTVTNPNANKLWAYLRAKHPESFVI
jgi:GT2 family glycosyltransferase/SAM-dependent methyltransferase